MNTLQIAITARDGISTVTLTGELDVYATAQTRAAFLDLVNTGQYRIIANLAGIDIMDSSGLAVLVGAHKRALAHGGELVLAAPTSDIANVLHLTGVNKSIRVLANVEEAHAALQQVATAPLKPVGETNASSDWKPTGTEENLHEILRSEYACTRHWSAWQYGTMTQEDFTPMGETEIVGDLIAWRDAAVACALAQVEDAAPATPADEAFNSTRARVDAAIAELRAAGTDGTQPAVREVRIRLMHELGDGPWSRTGVLSMKAVILAEKIEREHLGWFHDTLGETGTAPVREALRDAVAQYINDTTPTAEGETDHV